MEKQRRLIAILRLKIRDESPRTLTVTDGQSLQVGRGLDNDLVLRDSTISRVHAVFNATLSGLTVNDMFSRNGTFVNGERISSLRHLNAGDVVDIGPAKFLVETPRPDEPIVREREKLPPVTTDLLEPLPLTVMLASFNDLTAESTVLKNMAQPLLETLTHEWCVKVQQIVSANSGRLDKIVGSNILAHWAVPDERVSAISACRTAIAIRLMFPNFLVEQKAKLKFEGELKATVILSSGRGMKRSGNKENERDEDYIILGQPAKLASALQEVIGPYGYDLIMPETTARLVQSRIQARKVFSVRVRGQSESVSAYTIELQTGAPAAGD